MAVPEISKRLQSIHIQVINSFSSNIIIAEVQEELITNLFLVWSANQTAT